MASIKTQPRTKQGSGGRKLNKAQEQAMRVRASQTVPRELHHAPAAPEPVAAEAAPTLTTPAAVGRRRAQLPGRSAATAVKSRVVAHPFVLSKQQEYAFIRADLYRLLITMGIIFAVMLVLLYIIEG